MSTEATGEEMPCSLSSCPLTPATAPPTPVAEPQWKPEEGPRGQIPERSDWVQSGRGQRMDLRVEQMSNNQPPQLKGSEFEGEGRPEGPTDRQAGYKIKYSITLMSHWHPEANSKDSEDSSNSGREKQSGVWDLQLCRPGMESWFSLALAM